MNIINITEKELKKVKKKNVEQIELEIGSISGVEISSLDYVWKAAIRKTVLENATLKINFIKAKAKCLTCKTTFKVEEVYDNCPKCNGYSKTILQGKEIRIKSLEII